jgi:long-subunit fatty acid transport protein
MMLALLASAHAGGLDLLEVGGAYGTPGATNPTAIWWNPAGLAADGGTQILLEGAPIFGRVIGDRANPDYGEVQPFAGDTEYPKEYDYSGVDKASLSGVVPFAGVKTNFMVPGLGFGLGLVAPIARGGQSDQEWGANRYALRGGDIRAVHLMAGGAYQIANKIALGASLSYVLTSYYADVDTTLYPDIENEAAALLGQSPDSFQDPYTEQKEYTATAVFGGGSGDDHGMLHGHALTFGAGVYLTPIGKKLGISLAYNHGYKAFNEGDLTLAFQCPPDHDFLSRVGAEQQGLCNATMNGTGTIAYQLPSRLHAGVVLAPIDRIRLEVMGGLVFWKVFDDYEIGTNIPASEVKVEDPAVAEETAALLTRDRLWARDAQNTGWVGVDAKMRFNTFLSGGARVLYDRHAIPTDSVSLNNHDADAIIPGVLLQVNPINQLAIGLSYSHQFLMARTVTSSAYAVTINEENAKEDRYFYPSANGTYKGSVDRIGITVRAQFGGPAW